MCTMDEETNYVSDTENDNTFSDSEKYKNYLEIVEAINYIENGSPVTEDWMEESILIVCKWRSWIPDFNVVNLDRQDKAFRDAARNVENALTFLCKEIAASKWLDVNMYVVLLTSLKDVCNMTFEEDELDNLMKMMSI